MPVVPGRAPGTDPTGRAGRGDLRINYKDDNAAAIKWLNELHNPYLLSISDADGTLGLDLGVYGAPETYLIDKQGIIRHKIVGVVDQKVWREQLAPLYQQLLDEPEAR